MTDEDLQDAQEMLKQIVGYINEIDQANRKLKEVAVKYQAFIVQRMVGSK